MLWTSLLDDSIPVDIVNFDFAKAFDSVPHKRLFTKIKSYDIEGNIYNWIKSFLTGRKQRVVLNGFKSEWTTVISEVLTFIYAGRDCHSRGVGLVLSKEVARALIGYWAISDRILVAKIQGRPFNICIIQLYAPTTECSEQDVEVFYEQLHQAKKQCKSQEILIVMGDLNTKVGQGRFEDMVGPHGLGERNERGDKWIEWCKENDQIILNTWFQHHPRRLWTWKSPAGNVKNQIDYVTINKRHRNAVTQVKCYPGADCGSDHSLLALWMKVKLKN